MKHINILYKYSDLLWLSDYNKKWNKRKKTALTSVQRGSWGLVTPVLHTVDSTFTTETNSC